MKTLAVVPARGGSKVLPGKNARPFLGVSLLERAIRIGAETCDSVVVTTDSGELGALAVSSGIPCEVHFRPPELATDEAPMLPVVQDAIRGRNGDVIVLLQPTQPLRTADHVRDALSALSDWGCESIVSVRVVPEQYWPDRALSLNPNGQLEPALMPGGLCGDSRRQDARPTVVRCGTVYATRRRVIVAGSLYGWNCRPLVLNGDALSIDTLEDFERLEALMRRRHGQEATEATTQAQLLGGPWL